MSTIDEEGLAIDRTLDISGMTVTVTKRIFVVTSVDEIPQVFVQAYQLASTGRPGPVLIDSHEGVHSCETEFVWPGDVAIAGYRPNVQPRRKQIRAAVELIVRARSPVLCVGGEWLLLTPQQHSCPWFHTPGFHLSQPI